jgi:hypothetical protein
MMDHPHPPSSELTILACVGLSGKQGENLASLLGSFEGFSHSSTKIRV